MLTMFVSKTKFLSLLCVEVLCKKKNLTRTFSKPRLTRARLGICSFDCFNG